MCIRRKQNSADDSGEPSSKRTIQQIQFALYHVREGTTQSFAQPFCEWRKKYPRMRDEVDQAVHPNYILPRMCIIHSSSPGLRMQLQVGLISCTAVTMGKKPLPLLVEYIESR